MNTSLNSQYYEVLVQVNDEVLRTEICGRAFSDFSCSGVEAFNIDEPEVDRILGERAYSGGNLPSDVLDEIEKAGTSTAEIQKFFFYEGACEENASLFQEYLASLNIESSTIVKKLKDWNESWRKNFQKIPITETFAIIPEWEKGLSHPEEHQVYIYPGMGFGTGNHETTFLCLKEFKELIDTEQLNGDKGCLDLGSGSGILGISYQHFFRSSFVNYVDIDKDSLNNNLRNIHLNFEDENLDGSSLTIREKLTLGTKYELIFANILEHIVELEYPTICEHSQSGSFVIVSGVLNSGQENIKNLFQNEFECMKTSSKGDWSCFVFRKK